MNITEQTPRQVAQFFKVSYEQFRQDWLKVFPHGYSNVHKMPVYKTQDERNSYVEQEVRRIYDSIKLPKRATNKSAGYDFYIPSEVTWKPNDSIMIPTGIRVCMQPHIALNLLPKSGLGSKYTFRFKNTIGLVDADYYFADNQGHIFAPLVNEGERVLVLEEGDKFIQGVFTEYFITLDDSPVTDSRTGGFGSTGTK